MNLPAALRYLDGHVNREAVAGRIAGLSLDPITELCAVLGDPHRAYQVVHVTGTNGKGSTARLVSTILRAHGLSVGTYGSPHLERINERIAWDGVEIADADLAHQIGLVEAVEPALGHRPSYFEILTAAAFSYFADQACDVAVVEVGLLGRWDATNIVRSDVAVVTNVGHDHAEGAGGGDARRRIAAEKAGIIDVDSTLVLGETDPALVPLFTAEGPSRTFLRDADFGCPARSLAVGGWLLDLRGPHSSVDEVFLPLHGVHQADNAAAALAAVDGLFDRPTPADLVAEAWAEITMPGRMEVIGRRPLVLLDGAHNVDGALAAAETLRDEFTVDGRRYLVVGLLQGRDPAEMFGALEVGPGDAVVACAPDSPRALPAVEIAAVAARLGADVTVAPDPATAVDAALGVADPDDLVFVTGSLYVVGAARSALLGARSPGASGGR